MAEHKYICGDCNKEFIRNYIVSKPRNGDKTKNGVENYKTYCSKECRVKGRAKERTYKECLNCKNSYYYHKSLENKFCSNKCKGEWYKLNSQTLQLAERANKARGFKDENSIKKGLETRKKNGNIIDWNKAGWKQYWKRCDWLTRKIRKQMLENWNGGFSTIEDTSTILITQRDMLYGSINNIAAIIIHESKHLFYLKNHIQLPPHEEELRCYKYELNFLNKIPNVEPWLISNAKEKIKLYSSLD